MKNPFFNKAACTPSHTFSFMLSLALSFTLSALFLASALPVSAQTLEERIEDQRAMPIESNSIPNWPQGPVVTAESAILMEAGTGTILYEKNIHQHQYPASCTTLLTCLIAAEQCEMDEEVYMSHAAVYDTPLDSSYISLDEGNIITMEQALNAILISSANNVAFAVAEHITGTDWQDFGDVMNKRAEELGCVDSNFVNPNGLPDENHYTSAYDLARIARVFFDNELLSKISRTSRLHLEPTETQPKDIIENSKNRLLPNQSMAYPYLVGSKTGYTNAARNCLVSCAEKDGLKLICVVLKDESPRQFEDTIALFEYGFGNFEKFNVSETETKYHINSSDAFSGGQDIFGSSKPLLELNPEAYLVLPITAQFDDTVSAISYDTENDDQAALISYTYQGVPVGTASVNFINGDSDGYDFKDTDQLASSAAPPPTSSSSQEKENNGQENQVVFINLKEAILWTALVLAILALLFIIFLFLRSAFASFWKEQRMRHPGKDTIPYLRESDSLRQKRKAAAKRVRNRRRRTKRTHHFHYLDD